MSQRYHHGNLRAVMIDHAVDLARETGPDGVVLREVARRAGVSHNAAYRHFADRDELLAAVADVGMDRLEQAMRDHMATVNDPDPARASVLRLREIGREYVRFAVSHTGLFTVAFATLDDRLVDGWAPPDGGPYGLLNHVLDEMVATGAMTPARRPGSEVACWAAVHGFAQLSAHGPLANAPADLCDAALEVMLDIVEDGLVRSRSDAR